MEFDAVNIKHGAFSFLDKIKQLIHTSKLALSSCDLCGNQCEEHPLLCQFCLRDLPKFNYQLISADLLNWPAINKIIPVKSFDHLHSLSPHTWPYTQWISSLKYKGRFELADLLGKLLYESWKKGSEGIDTFEKNTMPELILSVPLYLTKWQYRGYNQAHLIAKKFAKYSGIHYQHNIISRILETESQVGKSGSQRRNNMKNAFNIKLDTIKLPKHVILIDDVVTTGTTVNEISSLLKKHGVLTVSVLSVTIALPESI